MILPEVRMGSLLKPLGWTLATAESCTGGLISHRLTDISGSSTYFAGGFVVYSNEAKMKFLNVKEETLIKHGAVSEQVAIEMAHGAKAALGTHLAVSVTGIAGPGGGTDEKPVGLTFIALATPENVMAKRFIWDGSRTENKELSATTALEMIIEYLESRS